MKRTYQMLLLVVAILFSHSLIAAEKQERNLLTSKYSREFVEGCLDKGTGWVTYPAYHDRKGWESLPDDLRSMYIREGEENLGHEWQNIPPTAYLEYNRSGNRRLQEGYLGRITGPLGSLFMAELMEGKGRFIDQIINGVWALCESSFWGSTAHLSLQRTGTGLPNIQEPAIDLSASRNAHFLSWVYYFLHEEFDKVHPFVSQRIEYEINRRILEPFYTREDFWWMGFGNRTVNNWNPYCNGHVLATIMLMEKDGKKRLEGVYKAMASLDKFTNGYGDDGGCDEGPSYWGMAGASNFESLLLLKKFTNGKVDIFDDPLIKNMAKYIYLVDISYPWFINFADAVPKTSPNAWLVYKYGESISDPLMMGFGSFLGKEQEFGQKRLSGTTFIIFESLFDLAGIQKYPPQEPLLRDFWLPDLQVMGARDQNGSAGGFFFAAKGGHNNESHNHNDVGSFLLYYNGKPVLVDAGVGTYTAQTFSSQRYDIWTMQSGYHNLPTINGVMQQPGRQYEASGVKYQSDDKKVGFSLDIAGAYPDGAQVSSWVRSYTLTRGKGLEIADRYQMKAFKEPFICNFLTAAVPVVAAKGTVELSLESGEKLNMRFKDTDFEVRIETVEQTDPRLISNWGEKLYRIQLVSKSARITGNTLVSVTR